MMVVDFIFGPGSRYSYLAATQLKHISAKTNTRFRWRAVFSPELIAASGGDNPFSVERARGQYAPNYRARDAVRWARHYGVPYVEPEFDRIDWRLLAIWCAASELLGNGFGAWILDAAFAHGAPPQSFADLKAGAATAGLDAEMLADFVERGDGEQRHAETLSFARAAGAFGVPTFVCPDGEVFWGQDRLPLLIDHLEARSFR